jgi:AcrR family transcriptional regulator
VHRAALDELAAAGYSGFTIEAVAARSGVAKSTIYRHWSDKVALLADAFEASHEHMVPKVETGTARERIERLLRHVAEVVDDSTFSRCIPALVEGAARDRRLRRFHVRQTAERRQGLVAVIEAGIADGEIAGIADADLAAQVLLGVIFYRRLMSSETFDPAEVEQLVEFVLGSKVR